MAKDQKKQIGTDSRLIELADPSSITTRDIVGNIMDRKPAVKNLEAALQKIFPYLLYSFPCILA